MTARPILFGGPMVRAILDGRKTVTRRVAKGCGWPANATPEEHRSYPGHWLPYTPDGRLYRFAAGGQRAGDCGMCSPCGVPGDPGDQLWVREAWRTLDLFDSYPPRDVAILSDPPIWYEADGPSEIRGRGRLRSSIHMPWWASRLDLEVVDVRPERLHDITDEDALAEGVDWGETTPAPGGPCAPAEAFARLWDEINGKRPGCAWRDDPWVWRVAFRRVGRGGV